MTAPGRLVGIACFGALSLGLLGYAVYALQTRIATLREDLSYAESRASSAEYALYDLRWGFENALSSVEVAEALRGMVASDDRAERLRLRDEILALVEGTYAPFPEGHRLQEMLTELAEAATAGRRAEILEAWRGTGDDGGLSDPVVEPVVVTEEAANVVSALVTAAGGLASALITVSLFLQGGGRRRLEEEMLSLDVEKRRLEVLRMRREMDAGRIGEPT